MYHAYASNCFKPQQNVFHALSVFRPKNHPECQSRNEGGVVEARSVLCVFNAVPMKPEEVVMMMT
jgi:hypothetical protein